MLKKDLQFRKGRETWKLGNVLQESKGEEVTGERLRNWLKGKEERKDILQDNRREWKISCYNCHKQGHRIRNW